VVRGQWAGCEGTVMAVEPHGTLVVKLLDAANPQPLIIESADCGRIMAQST